MGGGEVYPILAHCALSLLEIPRKSMIIRSLVSWISLLFAYLMYKGRKFVKMYIVRAIYSIITKQLPRCILLVCNGFFFHPLSLHLRSHRYSLTSRTNLVARKTLKIIFQPPPLCLSTTRLTRCNILFHIALYHTWRKYVRHFKRIEGRITVGEQRVEFPIRARCAKFVGGRPRSLLLDKCLSI